MQIKQGAAFEAAECDTRGEQEQNTKAVSYIVCADFGIRLPRGRQTVGNRLRYACKK